jgi:hypothetical protein
MARPRNRLLLLVPAVVAALGGCTARGDFPSLAMRPAEREPLIEAPARAPTQTTSDAALLRQVSALEARGTAGARDFDAAYGPAEAAVARAGASGSDAWIEAQVALSRLEAARGQATSALADLEQLALDRADRPTGASDRAAIDAALARLRARAAGDQARLDGLKRRLSAL